MPPRARKSVVRLKRCKQLYVARNSFTDGVHVFAPRVECFLLCIARRHTTKYILHTERDSDAADAENRGVGVGGNCSISHKYTHTHKR